MMTETMGDIQIVPDMHPDTLVVSWDSRLVPGTDVPLVSVTDRMRKHSIMKSEPRAYMRGANELVFKKLLELGVLPGKYSSDRTYTLANGDLHLNNLGISTLPDGTLCLRMNDFDEGIVTDWKVDKFHVSADLFLAFDERFSRKKVRESVRIMTSSYFHTLRTRRFRHEPLTELPIDSMPDVLREAMQGDMAATQIQLLRTFTEGAGNGRRFKITDGIEEIDEDGEYALFRDALEEYRSRMPEGNERARFDILDIAKRTGAGLGSYGMPRYFALVRSAGRLKILDIKSAVFPPTGYYFASQKLADAHAAFVHETPGGEAAWRVMTRNALIGGDETFAGWMNVLGIPFFVRERKPVKKEMNLKKIKTKEQLYALASELGKLIAGNHVHAHHALVDSGILLGVSESSFKDGVLDAVKHEEDACAKLITKVGEEVADYMHSFVGAWSK